MLTEGIMIVFICGCIGICCIGLCGLAESYEKRPSERKMYKHM